MWVSLKRRNRRDQSGATDRIQPELPSMNVSSADAAVIDTPQQVLHTVSVPNDDARRDERQQA